jgi:hypothetical protein
MSFLLAIVGTMIGLGLMWALPVAPPEPAFSARIEWWEKNAEALAREHHIERAATWCGHSACPADRTTDHITGRRNPAGDLKQLGR